MGYENFEAAIYCTVRDMERIAASADFDKEFAFIEKHIRVGKVYLETYRGRRWVDREKLVAIKEFFSKKGIKTSGGLTPDVSGSWEFQPLCYTDAEQRELLKKAVRFSAELFDELILDDFFFTNCRCPSCIEAKGGRSWSDFRTELLKEASAELVIGPAKEVNPNIQVVIKFPNWYDDYQTTGYNLADAPKLFDKIYAGTETREPRVTQQNLQRYLSYFLLRYLENVKPGANGGGWFDGYDCRYNPGSYGEQCYLTLFAKAKEVTLFSIGQLLYRDRTLCPIAGSAMEQADGFLNRLGRPSGIACYKPCHSSGENYLHGFLGMLGLPLEPSPEFPSGRKLVLLTESAGKDPQIVDRIREHLRRGGDLVITSGLLKTLAGRGIEEIATVRCTDRKALVKEFAFPTFECSFGNYVQAAKGILIPQVEFSTNDALQCVVGLSDGGNYPVFLQTKYAAGSLYVLTVPDDFGDLYALPDVVLDQIRKVCTKDLGVRLEGPSQIGLFLYDNRTLIVESFLPSHANVRIVSDGRGLRLVDLVSGVAVEGVENGGKTEFGFKLPASTFSVFQLIGP